MEKAYRAADLILCRGGGMTLSEVAFMGLPAVIVPYPHHRDRHQFHNAKELIETGGAILLDEKHFSSDAFCREVVEVLVNAQRLSDLSKGAKRAGRPGGAEHILALIQEDLDR
jgi:UDP-N-acetylglucosamine--N-acetylmuramyl-(pentapeptide) pyrophosphoryl-undecaprenol N-acetylglucosamine transferase